MIEHGPAEITVRVVSLMEQAADDVVKVTGYEGPALLVATKACGVLTVVNAVGGVKVMVWALLAIVMLLTTLLAAK